MAQQEHSWDALLRLSKTVLHILQNGRMMTLFCRTTGEVGGDD